MRWLTFFGFMMFAGTAEAQTLDCSGQLQCIDESQACAAEYLLEHVHGPHTVFIDLGQRQLQLSVEFQNGDVIFEEYRIFPRAGGGYFLRGGGQTLVMELADGAFALIGGLPGQNNMHVAGQCS